MKRFLVFVCCVFLFSLHGMSRGDDSENVKTAMLLWRMHNFFVLEESFKLVAISCQKEYSYDVIFGFNEKSNCLGIMHYCSYVSQKNLLFQDNVRCSTFNFKHRVWENKCAGDFLKKQYKIYADQEIFNLCKKYIGATLCKDSYLYITKAVISNDYTKAALMTLSDVVYVFALRETRFLLLNQLSDATFYFE